MNVCSGVHPESKNNLRIESLQTSRWQEERSETKVITGQEAIITYVS